MKLVLSPLSEPPGCREAACGVVSRSSNFHKCSILGIADNWLVSAGGFESSTARGVGHNYRTKSEKVMNKKYIPKKSNAA